MQEESEMPEQGSVVVIGGTTGLGREIATHYAGAGEDVVISGRDEREATQVADEIGGRTRGISLDLSQPAQIAERLAHIGPVRYLVITPILRDDNKVREFNIEGAMNLVTMKLVGYAEAVHQLLDRLSDDSAIVLFGGLAKERPYPGSTTVSTVNGGIVGMVRTLVGEIAPIRINAIHPGIVGDSPYWSGKNLDHILARTPTKRLTTMADITHAVRFLLENQSVNGINLYVDGGWTTT
jgi:NAD(P)-dependent dehydrogenase (short-subunit alcohol dehydrogenase family)